VYSTTLVPLQDHPVPRVLVDVGLDEHEHRPVGVIMALVGVTSVR